MFALLDDWIDQELLSETWHEITGDSFVVDIRKVKKQKDLGYAKAAAEVCKYALKFGDLTVENTWEAFKVLKGKRLSGAFGSLYGVKIPENLADDMPEEKDLPYLEMLYKFVFGKHSYYNLEITRHVEPQAGERAELGGVATTPDERYSAGGSSVDDLSTEAGGGLAPLRRTKRGRKKQHWQLPPVTRVRVKKRIKRWDGYLCVIHM